MPGSARSASSQAVTVLSNAATRSAGGKPRGPHPGSPEDGRLLERERWVARSGAAARASVESACAQSTRGSQTRQPRATRKRVTLEDHAAA